MKILVIGCGSIGRRHARNLLALGVSELLLFDSDPARAERLSEELRVPRFASLDEAYDNHPKAAVVCAPTSLHLPLASQALKHDCHLFIEKPISDSSDAVATFLGAARARNRMVMVGYNLRFDPLLQKLRKFVEGRLIGEVISARFHFGSYLPWRHPGEDYRRGYGARRILGGGVILDAIHELDLPIWFFGQPDGVYCSGGKFSELEIDVEDIAEISLRYPNRLVSIHLNSVQMPAERWCHLIGARGQLYANLFERIIRHYDGDKRTWRSIRIECLLEDSYREEMRHFIARIKGKSEPLVDGELALQSLYLAEAAKNCMASGLPVSFECAIAGAQYS
jgi:predicted dehydrogenase